MEIRFKIVDLNQDGIFTVKLLTSAPIRSRAVAKDVMTT